MAHAGGRPTIYNDALSALICRRVATHPLSTKKLCKMYDDMPDDSTLYDWRYMHPEFASKYAAAKAAQAELMAETLDEMCEVPTHEDQNGITRVDPGMVALQRLKVDTTKWFASKLAPKIYGDKKHPEAITNEDALSKVAALVADFNKVNESDV